MLQRSHYSRKAFTLIELMLVIAVIVVIIITATRLYQQDKENVKANNAVQQVLTIKNAADHYIANLSTADLCKLQSKELLDHLINVGLLTDTYRTSPWGTHVSVKTVGAAQEYNVYMYSLPANGCEKAREQLETFRKMGSERVAGTTESEIDKVTCDAVKDPIRLRAFILVNTGANTGMGC